MAPSGDAPRTKQKGTMVKKGDNPKNTPPAGGEPSGDTTPASSGNAGGEFDPTKLSNEQLGKVLEDPRLWKTERLSELRANSKALKKLKADQEKAEQKKLEEEGEYKKLLAKTRRALKTANAKIGKLGLRNRIANAAIAKGVKDVDAAVKLIDTTKITKGEDGEYSGINEAVDSLLKERPYLVTSQQSVGSPTNPGASGEGVKQYTISQIQDPEFYEANRDDILKAQREGRIKDDRQVVSTVAPTSP